MKFDKSYEAGKYEEEIYRLWEESGSFRPSGEGEPYAIVMPPPNANGNLHIGHGFEMSLKDILIRYHRMKGDDTIYIPGADHAGFETWVVFERKLEAEGKSRFDYSRDKLYEMVYGFVAEQRGNMEKQIRRLGISCDWDSLVFTLDKKVVDTVYDTFEKMWKDKLVYRGKRLVNYCTKHQTAFADIEVSYEEAETPLYYIKYGPFTLATTRPETVFGDTGVAIHPEDERYQGWGGKDIEIEGVNGPFKVRCVADEMVDREFGTGVVKITPAHDFNDFEVGMKHGLPAVQVIDKTGRMTEAAGRFAGMTVMEARKAVVGAMHEMGIIVDVDEHYKNRVGRCYKCGTVIEPMLMEQWFIKVEPLAKKAIKAIEKDEVSFYPESKKRVMVNYLENLRDWNISRQIPWGIPIPMFKRIEEKIEEGGTVQEGAAEWIFDRRVEQAEIEVDGVRYTRDEDTFDTWFSSGQWPFIVTDYLSQEQTVDLNQSFSNRQTRSGTSYAGRPAEPSDKQTNLSASSGIYVAALAGREGSEKDRPALPANENGLKRFYPNAVMENGVDILFPWDSKMIMLGLYRTGKVPFRDLYVHGMILDEKGQKMSKSKGNVVNPMEIIEEFGADAFRFGIVGGRGAGMSQAYAPAKVVAGRNLCNKLWNVARYVENALNEQTPPLLDQSFSDPQPQSGTSYAGNPAEPSNEQTNLSVASGIDVAAFAGGKGLEKDQSAPAADVSLEERKENMAFLGDQWAVREVLGAGEEVGRLLEDYRFAEAGERVYELVWNKVADWYVEASKSGFDPEVMRWVMANVLKIAHPFLPFVTEVIWQNLSFTEGLLIESGWSEKREFDEAAAREFEEVMKVVEKARSVMNALGGKRALVYGGEGADLIKNLTKASEVKANGSGVRLVGVEAVVEASEDEVRGYKEKREAELEEIRKEIRTLQGRLANKGYVERAPKELVAETKRELESREAGAAVIEAEIDFLG